MRKSSKSQLHFDTKENVRSSRLKRFAAAFCCFFVLLAGVSFLLLLRYYDFDLSKMVDRAPTEQSTETTERGAAMPQVSGTENYLLLCTADDSNALRFAVVVRADLDEKTLAVLPLSTSLSVEAPGCTGTLEQQLDFGGEKQLALAVEVACNTTVDKYVRSRDSGFKSIANYMGGLEVNVEEGLDVRSDKLTAVISAGEQTMTGDTLLKYIRCFEERPEKQASIISDMIEQLLTPATYGRADEFYTRVINLVMSDISVLDFARMKRGVEALLYEADKVTISVAASGE